MDWLTFISNIFSSLAWPATIVFLLFLLRNQIKELIPALKNLKYKDFEINFEKQMEKIEKQADEANLPNASQLIISPAEDTHPGFEERINLIKDMNTNSPRAAVIESWLLIEEEMKVLAEKYRLKGYTPLHISRELYKNKYITHELFEIIDQLRNIRNEAVHTNSFSLSSFITREYMNSSLRVLGALRKLNSEVIAG